MPDKVKKLKAFEKTALSNIVFLKLVVPKH